jgi:hypothetical protein
MAFRILSLLLCLLIAGPMSLPAHALAQPETRVWEIFSSPLKSASADLDQTVDTRRESGAYGYDFASGVCKYLYAANNPVNMVDPSGNEYSYVGISATTGIMLFLASHYAHASSSAIFAAEAQFGHGDFVDLAYGLQVAGLLIDAAGLAGGGVAVASAGGRIINWLRHLPENGAPVRGFVSGFRRLREIANLEKAGSQTAAAELRAARVLRENGVNVHAQAPSGPRGPGTADFLIGGQKGTGRGGIPADVYAPGPNTPIKNILSNIADKNNQARVIIVDLNRPGVTVTESDLVNACNGDIGNWVRTQLNAPNIQEVLVLPKIGQ